MVCEERETHPLMPHERVGGRVEGNVTFKYSEKDILERGKIYYLGKRVRLKNQILT